jgi:signal transduction histidine kinase
VKFARLLDLLRAKHGLSFVQWILIFATAFAVSLPFSDPGHHVEEVRWRLCPADTKRCDAPWLPGGDANAGYNAGTLQFDVRMSELDHPSAYLSVSPSYHDYIKAEFYSVDDELLGVTVRGDTQIGEVVSVYDIEQTTLPVPDSAARILLSIRSIGGLRGSISLSSVDELQSSLVRNISIRVSIIVFIVLSGLLGLAYGIVRKDKMLLLFGAYQISWTLFLLSLSNLLPVSGLVSPLFNHHLVGFGAIFCSIVGCWLHLAMLRYVAPGHRILKLVAAMPWLLVGAVILYVAGWYRAALTINVVLVTLTALTVAMAISRAGASHGLAGLFLERVRFFYVMLLAIVVVTTISGVGVGKQFSLTYLHSVLVAVVFGVILLYRSALEQTAAVRAARRSDVIKQRKTLLEQRLADQNMLTALLTHEIKTPLATLLLMTRNQPDAAKYRLQLKRIQRVVDQVAASGETEEAKLHNMERVPLSDLVESVVSHMELNDEQLARLYYSLRGRTVVTTHRFSLSTVLSNLLDNAFKYGDETSKVCLRCWRSDGKVFIRVRNTLPSGVQISDPADWFNKYWRASHASDCHGMGLGLWLVKNIARQQGYRIRAKRAGQQVVMTVELS